VGVTVYVEGVAVSTLLKDTALTLSADPEADGTFEVAATKPVTVARVTISPNSGRLGTPITIQLEPAIWPLAFDCQSTVAWEGVYQPLLGPATGPFQVSYAPAQVCRLSVGEAIIHVGDGTFTAIPDVTQLPELGVFTGALALQLPAAALPRSFMFAITAHVGGWASVYYPEDEFGYLPLPPTLGAPLAGAPLLFEVPTPGAVPEYLAGAYAYHAAAVVRVAGAANSFPMYSNTTAIVHPISFMTPGSATAGRWVADDVSLIAPGGCNAMGYEVAVYGGGGPDFNVHVELFDFYETLFDFPGDWTCREILPAQIEGTGIPGTSKEFTGLPGSAISYLQVPLDTTLPERFWVYLSFSTDQAGWIIAGFPEIGDEAISDCYGGNSGDFCQICFNFDENPSNPQAAMWTQVYCDDGSGGPCVSSPSTIKVDLVS
jgi:hypothetical protein